MSNFSYFRRARKVAVAGLAILVCVSFSAVGQTPPCNVPHALGKKLAARDALNKGVQAFKKANYDEAICYFQDATELDAHLLIAKQYLGTAVGEKVVPGLDTPENLKIAQQAIDIFQQYLKMRPHDVISIKWIAGIYFNIKRLDEAKAWQKKVLIEDPKDPEAAYTVGVIDWMEAYHNTRAALAPIGFNDDGEGNAGAPAETMEKIRAQNSMLVAEALEYLSQAVTNRPNYADAMAYLNLMYRRKADLDWAMRRPARKMWPRRLSG
jgi:tetratricopeptide (TPR) repeat protein